MASNRDDIDEVIADRDFNDRLQEFEKRYPERRALIKDNLLDILSLITESLSARGVVFQQPIPWRMKTLDSAKESLRKRRNARMKRSKLKELLGQTGKLSWETYWDLRHKPDRKHELGDFLTTHSMFEALHDIGGARVLVYFPSHIDKTVDILRKHDRIVVHRVIKKGQMGATDKDDLELEKFIDIYQEKEQPDVLIDDKPFVGYRATHVHVSLKENQDVVVEIQISTVVMNAWSQVEHDIIYKPQEEPTQLQEETKILDIFNGVVIIGENALRQLEDTVERKEEARKANDNKYAKSFHELGTWIEIFCAETSLYGNIQTWYHLPELFDVLKAGEQHTFGKVRTLVTGLKKRTVDFPKDYSRTSTLPLYLMEELYRIQLDKMPNNPAFSAQHNQREARFLAWRVIQTLNVADCLGIQWIFVSGMQESLPKSLPKGTEYPTMLDFLDILHPVYPCVHHDTDEKITEFCKSFLDIEAMRDFWRSFPDRKLPRFWDHTYMHFEAGDCSLLLELPIMLVEMGLVACLGDITFTATPIEHSYEKEIIVPISLCRLLVDTNCIPELYSEAAALISRDERMMRHPDPSKLMALTFLTNWESYSGGRKYRVDKQPAKRENQGFFRAIPEPDSPQSRKWEFIEWVHIAESRRRWELQKAKSPLEQTWLNPLIPRQKPRKDELVDFANAIIPDGGLKYKEKLMVGPHTGAGLYIMTVKGVDFHLVSTENEFILYKGSI
jgi:ppGpp synthetase/RelA/SpoT-type nucleotidyltranferase